MGTMLMPTQVEMLAQISKEVAMFDLRLEAKNLNPVVGEHFDVELWAATSPGNWMLPTPLGVLHVLLLWDPAQLDLVTQVTHLGTNPVMAAFPRLQIVTANDDMEDGNALWMLYPNFGVSVNVPSYPGMRIATFKFKAVGEGGSKVQIGGSLPGGRIGDNTRNATWLRHPEFGVIAGHLSFLNRRLPTEEIVVKPEGEPVSPEPDLGQAADPFEVLQRIIEWLSDMVALGQPIKPEQFQTLLEQVSTLAFQADWSQPTGTLTADFTR